MLRRLRNAGAGREAAAARGEAESAALAHAGRLMAEVRDEINRADAKAQVLLGVAGVGLGAVAGGLFAGDWSPYDLSNAVEWLWWTGVAAALGALACLSGAVYPRTGARRAAKPSIAAYYGDIARFESVRSLAAALLGGARPDLRQVSDQLRTLSRIAHRKYVFIRWGFWLLGAAVGCTVIAIVADQFL
ncbi:hypothetical protein Skr01_63530 [Sphaerisporangium krabiense]|uniref:Pycsar effector protein domain-containing protein n=1 Tax=Sphaerisporangium krabiense TaxID=763782 RepID=A0A7W8Z718_9ACTN|nr:Pycsar system effector family protein [Sphaerisporangium krabiense]MBB5628273.1 hypothetical protein [Sphaerisporangium krabiense]GII66268.1 hypothetical protein Skr01_63530 [Sphaerisporangium krabiense]